MENSGESLRCRYFDVVKGVGILCVFMGHSFVYGALPSRKLAWERPWFRFGLLAATAATAHLIRLVPIEAQFRFPFALSSVPGCLFFFFAGSFSRDWLHGFRQTQGRRLGRAVVGFVVSFALLAGLSACLNHTFNLCLARFHVALLPMCVAGLSTVFFGAALADRAGGIGAVLAWMGRHGLCLFAMEHPIDNVFCKVLSLCGYAARPVPNCYEHSHLYGVFRTVVVLAVCAALVPVFEWILVSFRRLLSNDMELLAALKWDGERPAEGHFWRGEGHGR